jgi:tetratricopeptide (TPR) repeat protein
LLHFGGALLFARILSTLAISGAWLAAFLFALHPVHVESVAWITEQKNTLSLLCYLLAFQAYLRFDRARTRRDWWIGFTWFTLSLLCKTVTATLPAALLVVFWWQRGRLDWRRDVRPLLPWLALGAMWGLFTSWVEQRYLGATGEDFLLAFPVRVLIAGRAFWFYLGHLVWPWPLNFIYSRWQLEPASALEWLFPVGVLLLFSGLWAARRMTRAPLATGLLFVGSLFPVLGFVNLYGARYSFVWDHWQYLPDLAPLTLFAASLTLASRHLKIPPGVAVPGSALCVLPLAVISHAHARMFHDETTLYRETLVRNPSAWMAHFNLANILQEQRGGEEEAIAHYQAALRLYPEHWKAETNLGNTLMKLPGREAEAEAHYLAALRIKPDLAEPHYDLGNILMRTGRVNEAIAHYQAAIALNPDFADAHYNLANAFIAIPGHRPEAIRHLEAVTRIRPTLAEAHFNLGILLMEDPARRREGITHLETAVRLRPDLEPTAREIVNQSRASDPP